MRLPVAFFASWTLEPSLSLKPVRTSVACAVVNVFDGISHDAPPWKSMERLRPRVNNETTDTTTSTAEMMSIGRKIFGKSKSLRPR